MELKLRLILKEIPWYLVIKALGLAWLWLWLPFWLWFVITLFVFYRAEGDPTVSYSRSFWVFALISGSLLYLPDYFKIWSLFWVATSMFLLMGLKEIFFAKKAVVLRALQIVLFLGGLTTFFWWSFYDAHFILRYLILFLATYWLFADLAKVIAGESQAVFWGGLATFLTIQITYATSLLSVEFADKAAIVLLGIIAIQEFLVRGERGKEIKPNFYLGLGSLFSAIFLLIVFLSDWSLI